MLGLFCKNARGAVLLLFAAALAPAAVPTPEGWFGHRIGADRELLDWDKVVSYFDALAQSSDKIRVAEFGRSAEGRPLVVATIAAPETLRALDRYREIQRRLADPRLTPPAEAEPFIAAGKNIVLMTCSIHATEVASTHSAVEFAYRLITEDSPRFRAILQNDILLLAPSINPDGVDIVTRWYRKTLGTAYEGTNPPELYQKYVGHDNNRDWYIFSQPETRAVISQLQNIWHPEIVYDVHQQGQNASRLFLPPWLDPIEPNVDPILAQEMNMIGTSMASDLTSLGFKGISLNSTYDFWTPSRHYQAFHGGLRILTESASARLASPVDIPFDQLDREALGYNAQESSWNFLEPWRGGHWTLRDIVDYQEAAFESCLYQAAIHREEMLRAFYRIGQKAVARTEPAAFLIPALQRDPGATRRMLETLAFGDVEIEREPGGGRVISMHQPYSSYAKALLERQHYPDLRMYPGGPPKRPYDVTAHTLPFLFGVDVQAVNKLPEGPFTRESFELGSRPPRSLSASDTDSWNTVNAIWSKGGRVWRDSTTGDFSDTDRGAGWSLAARPRIGLYRSWVPSIDEGWTRWLLEQFGFTYTRVTNEDLQHGDLMARFDVIVFPDESSSDLAEGYTKGHMPEEFTGGIGDIGADALKAFAQSGGTLIFLNRSTSYAIRRLGIPVHSVTESLPNAQFYCPGSLLNVALTPGPLTLGLPQQIAIWSEQSPAWDITNGSVARYPASGVLASGWLLGEPVLAGKSALVDARLGAGHVILFGLRPQYRAQSYQAFKLFFNALLDR
jgi:hypothetical protein